ncbi:MAG: hypothetical protein FJ253_09805 [Phycisphaerae bacterium]|nr:hypothetical protein [Phycisphaerae bacterium]
MTAATVEPTILQRDFNGRVRVLDDEPEVAALRLLLVDPELRSALDSITTRRISDFDELVRSHVPELLQGVAALQRLEAAASAGERLAAIGSFSHAWLAFAPWRDRGSAIDEMGDRLDDSTRRIAQRLVGRYRSALLVERAADLGVPARNPQAILTVRLESFARMVEQSFERQTRSGEQDFDRFVKALDLTPAQTERARVIFGALYEKEVARTATGWDRFKAITDFMEELPARQRARAWKFLRAEGG